MKISRFFLLASLAASLLTAKAAKKDQPMANPSLASAPTSENSFKTMQPRSSLRTSFVIQKDKVSQIHSTPLFAFEIGPDWDQWFWSGKYRFEFCPVWQISTLGKGQISFSNNNNVPISVGAEIRRLLSEDSSNFKRKCNETTA